MHISTTRFGTLKIEADDLIHFPKGVLGLEDCRHWVLLADSQNDSLGWLQSVSHEEIALAVVSPRRFVPGYQLRVYKNELAPLELKQVTQAQVLVVVGKNDRAITLNLKAPLVVNLERRLGRQVVSNAEQPVQYELQADPLPLRKIA